MSYFACTPVGGFIEHVTPVAYTTGGLDVADVPGYTAVALAVTVTVNDAEPQATGTVADSAGAVTTNEPEVFEHLPVHVTV